MEPAVVAAQCGGYGVCARTRRGGRRHGKRHQQSP